MSITLNEKTYNGSGIVNGIAIYMDRSAGVSAGFSKLDASVRFETKNRILWKLSLPIVATEASACSCPGAVLALAAVDLNVRLDPSLTLAQRTDFALRLKDLVATPEFQASIINLQVPAA